jgi:predicted permease
MEAGRVVTAKFELGRQRYHTAAQQLAFFSELERRLAAAPGVEAAAISDTIPLSGGMRSRPFSAIEIDGKPRLPEGTGGMTGWRYVTPGYFSALGIPIVHGRDFIDADRAPAAFAAILSESLARRLFPGENPIGRRILRGPQGQWTTVVGVVRDVANTGATRVSNPEFYILRKAAADYNFANGGEAGGWRAAFVVARTAVDPALAASSIRGILASMEPGLPVEFATMQQNLKAVDQRPRFYALLLGAFAAMGVAIAAIGLFGVMSFLVSQRTREIGVRMALGATRASILRMTLGSAARWTMAGILLGAAGSIAAARVLTSLLFHVTPGDPTALAAAAAAMCGVALLATAVPARKAASLDPNRTLREE